MTMDLTEHMCSAERAWDAQRAPLPPHYLGLYTVVPKASRAAGMWPEYPDFFIIETCCKRGRSVEYTHEIVYTSSFRV